MIIKVLLNMNINLDLGVNNFSYLFNISNRMIRNKIYTIKNYIILKIQKKLN